MTATRRCLLQLGPAKVGMGDVATVAGLSRATVYKYFAAREELMQAVTAEAMKLVALDIDDGMSTKGTLAERLANAAAVVTIWTALSRSRPAQLLSGADEAFIDLQNAPPILDMICEALQPYLERALEDGEISPGVSVARATEWVARALLSITAIPYARTFDIDAPGSSAAFIRDFIVTGLTGRSESGRAPQRRHKR